MPEHLGVLYVKGGYTTQEGTLVCLVLFKAVVGQLSSFRHKWSSLQCRMGVP